MYRIKTSINTITGKTYTSYITIDDGEGNPYTDYDTAWEVYKKFSTLMEDTVNNGEKITSVVLDDLLDKKEGSMVIVNLQNIVAVEVEFVELGK